MTPVWRSDSYRFGFVVRDRPPIPPRQKTEAFDMLMIRWACPPQITRQKIKNWVSVRNMGSENGNWGVTKNQIGAEWARE